MSALRVLAVVALIAAGLGASVLLAARGAEQLRPSPPSTGPGAVPAARPVAAGPRRHGARRTRRRPTPAAQRDRRPARPAPADGGLPDLTPPTLLVVVALELAGGAALVVVVLGALVVRRVRARRRRRYEPYELHLSTHDEAKPQDLEDMVEAIANIVRAWPADRARHGQPFVAIELICGAAQGPDADAAEMEWSINVRCEPAVVGALDGATSAAYPDVRVGRAHGARPLPRPGALRKPGHVMRFRKERSFVYPLVAGDETPASPPLEQIALAQVALQAPSVVRFQLTPTPSFFEELARRLYRRHENKLVRQERWGLPEGGLSSTLNRSEMRNAQRTQNRSMFWLEVAVAADTRHAAKTVAAAVQSRRGENRLHRRWMVVRQNLYRRRFPEALGPLLPSPRALVSAAEVAHLLELPSARMKGVPVRRVTIPRIPAPPEALRASDLAPVASPATEPAPARPPATTTAGAA